MLAFDFSFAYNLIKNVAIQIFGNMLSANKLQLRLKTSLTRLFHEKKIDFRYACSHQFLKTDNYLCKKHFKKNFNQLQPLQRFTKNETPKILEKKQKTKGVREIIVDVVAQKHKA